LPMGIQELNVNCNQNLSIGIMNKEFIEKIFASRLLGEQCHYIFFANNNFRR